MAAAPWATAWITGASTGIGREVALRLAERGVRVAASARSTDALAALGEGIRPYPLDVTDPAAVLRVHDAITRDLGPIDLALLSAGTYRAVDMTHFDPRVFIDTNAVNYLGVVNCLAALVPSMRARRRGHIAWIASVAGYRGLPKAAAYGPTKAALINLAESLRPELERDGVTVSVVNPGFVATPLTAQNEFPMPFLMTPEAAAQRIVAGLESGRFEIAFPRRFAALLKCARLLPYPLFFALIRRYVMKR